MPRVAVVLFNLGGPDELGSVRPFLFNLFSDPAILGLPNPMRWVLAKLIAARRAPVARGIYAEIGGGSPLLANTLAQAGALQAALRDIGEVRVFPCMRYWHPMSAEVARAVEAFAPQEILLLPLYPQFSSTTTGSSVPDWARAATGARLAARTRLVCCYPTEPGFIAALAQRIRPALAEAEAATGRQPRLLLSAHGLPKRTVARGDPYPDQVEQTAAAVAADLALPRERYVVCYQSRVGPLEWIGPATDAEIRRAGAERLPVVVAPIAFVSEHSETLVELDIEYRRLAEQSGVPRYVRVPTVGTDPAFVAGLAHLIRAALADPRPVRSQAGPRLCDPAERCCLNRAA